MRRHHNKLYFGKYRFKTVLKIPGNLMFYPTTDQYLIGLRAKHPEAHIVHKLANFIIENRNMIKFRMQDKLSIFYSNKDIASDLINKFWNYWYKSEEVNPKHATDKKDVVSCSRLPHGKFQYQIHLKKDAHIYSDASERKNLWNLLSRNPKDCLITSGPVEIFLNGRNPHLFRGYFYVRTEKWLSPIYMIASKMIDKVIKYEKV